jgi:hypothetical protein
MGLLALEFLRHASTGAHELLGSCNLGQYWRVDAQMFLRLLFTVLLLACLGASPHFISNHCSNREGQHYSHRRIRPTVR